jgi:dTDP-glucose 4,6-dehydratase
VRAWHKTYGLPVVTSHASNTYGTWQHPEKLIPRMILDALEGTPLPIYGDARQVRDWLHVDDLVRALVLITESGRVGETYNIGARNEKRYLEVVSALCDLLDELLPGSPHRPHVQLITFVRDRPGHDWRYAIDAGKIRRDLRWWPRVTFETGLSAVAEWYLIKNRQLVPDSRLPPMRWEGHSGSCGAVSGKDALQALGEGRANKNGDGQRCVEDLVIRV